ncbi:MAG: hypothetical protein QMC00_05385 [Pseudomonadales bacterium]|jgi:hypothetical protein|tara:strand:+ start:259 stop:807 length:549 start_codon:yes stop_codon:yes gene_type:complete
MKILTALLVALLVALANSSASAEEIYREISDKGVPTFSDQATPGAEPITIRKPSIFTDKTYQQRQLTGQSDDSPSSTNIDYSLLVTHPNNDSVIRDNAGNLSLTISISPSVQSPHSAELLMDGTKIRDLYGSGIISLTNVDRGTHAFNIRVIDQQGNVVSGGPSHNISILRYHTDAKPRSRP